MKRTEPKLIGDILDEFFSRPYIARKIAEGRIPQYWREVVGEKIASLTTYCRLEGVILYIGISSGVARQEVFYRRDELAQCINQRAGHDIVRSIIVK